MKLPCHTATGTRPVENPLRHPRLFLYPVFFLLASLILLEISVRVWGYSDGDIYDPIYMPFGDGKSIPFAHKPNLTHALARSRTYIDTDSLGLRCLPVKEVLSRPGDAGFRIAFVGNSITFGQGVTTSESFPIVTAQALQSHSTERNILPRNFGVAGYSVREMAWTVVLRTDAVDPNAILFCAGIEDFDTTRCGGVDKWGYNVNVALSGDFDKDSIFKRWLRSLHLSYVIRDLRRKYFAAHLPEVSITDNPVMQTQAPKSYHYVLLARDHAQSHHIPFYLVLLPSMAKHGGQFTGVAAQAKRDSLALIDLSYMGGMFAPEQFAVSRFDAHPSADVHHAIGDSLAEALFRGGLLVKK